MQYSQQSSKPALKARPQQINGSNMSPMSPQVHSTSPQNHSRDHNALKQQNLLKVSGALQSKVVLGPGRKAVGMTSSNSPKNLPTNPNKLFLAGFRQEHQKLFQQDQSSSNQLLQTQYTDYKKIPTSTKNGNQQTKIIFTSPGQGYQKTQHATHSHSKKNSPDSSQNTYMKIGESSDQQANLMNLLKRRVSEEKQVLKLNKSGQSNGPQNARPSQNQISQEYINQKARSPQNNPGKGDYYLTVSNTQQNFAMKPNQSQQQLNTQLAPQHQFPQKSRNLGGGVAKYKTTNQFEYNGNQLPEFQPSAFNKPKVQSPLQKTANKTGNAFYDKRQSYQPISQKQNPSDLAKKLELDEQEDEDDEDEKQWMQEQENQKGPQNFINASQVSVAGQKNLREIARKLWLAVEVGDKLATLKILQPTTQHSVIINCTNTDGWAPLHLAASEGHVQIVEILIEYGAVMDSRTKNFRTPLHISCIRGNLGVIQALLMSGADPDAKDIDGNTPAHFCAEYGHQDSLRFLLTRHPTLFAKNSEGKSPIDVAVSHEILQTFEEYIKSVKHFLYNKNQTGSNPNLTNKNKPENNSQHSSEGSNSVKHTKQLQVDDATLKQRATTNQIQISTTQSQPEKKRVTGGAIVGQRPDLDLQTQFTSVQQQQTFSSNSSNTNSQATDDEKVGPNLFIPIKMLGSGSFGEVYLVKEKRSSKLYAMKVLSKQKIMGQNLVRYAKTERDVLSYTKHPFIVNLNYAFQTKTKLFLILDFCPGGDLGKILQRERKFTEERAKIYAAEIILALDDLHNRDIIYRDLKPDNVVLEEEGHAQLTDFGLSKEGVLEGAKGAKSFCGSVAYLAPEMLRRVGHGKSVDWYLLGVLIYEMVVGCPPYFSPKKDELFYNIQKGVLKIPASLSEECKNLIVSLLNRNPSKRLGAGPEGADEIKRHAFFNSINWQDAKDKKLKPPKPEVNMKFYAHAQNYMEAPDESLKRIFDDYEELDADIIENRTVQGWSFVQGAGVLNDAGNQQER